MSDLISIARELSDARPDAPLPVENWHPAHEGRMDLVIKADGTWIHEGRPIARPALVRLFSRVLRRDEDGYVLVTPAEKLSIQVEDVPFLAVDFDRRGDDFVFKTNVGDQVALGPDHAMTMRPAPGETALLPYIHIRGALLARLGRAAYYRLLDEAEEDDSVMFIVSGGIRFDLGGTAA